MLSESTRAAKESCVAEVYRMGNERLTVENSEPVGTRFFFVQIRTYPLPIL
jgi:hypothetical protein